MRNSIAFVALIVMVVACGGAEEDTTTEEDTITGVIATLDEPGHWDDCRGSGEDADIAPGTSVIITDVSQSGEPKIGEAALRNLTEADFELLAEMGGPSEDAIRDADGFPCYLIFEANGVEEAEVYLFQVEGRDHRGNQYYPQELEESGRFVVVNL